MKRRIFTLMLAAVVIAGTLKGYGQQDVLGCYADYDVCYTSAETEHIIASVEILGEITPRRKQLFIQAVRQCLSEFESCVGA